MADIIDARVMLERNSATLAAAQADEGRLAEVRAPLLAMDDIGTDCEPFNDADTAFHVAIAEASGNRLVADMTIAIRASLRQPILDAMRQVADWPGLAGTLQSQHHAIYDAIAARDGRSAADLTERHIRGAFGALTALHY
jgi:GntR family transcriptional repressor for pyruvate dehydrogenase complex